MLDFFLGCYIGMRSAHDQRPLIRVPFRDLAPVLHPDPSAVLMLHAHLTFILGIPGKMLAQQRVAAFKIVGMAKALPRFDGYGPKLRQGVTDDPGPSLIKRDVPRLYIPYPCACV